MSKMLERFASRVSEIRSQRLTQREAKLERVEHSLDPFAAQREKLETQSGGRPVSFEDDPCPPEEFHKRRKEDELDEDVIEAEGYEAGSRRDVQVDDETDVNRGIRAFSRHFDVAVSRSFTHDQLCEPGTHASLGELRAQMVAFLANYTKNLGQRK